MTLLKTDIRTVIESFQKANRDADRIKSLYAGQLSDLYNLIEDDIKAKEAGKAISRKRRNKKSINELPSYSAPLDFEGNSKLPSLWECKMTNLDSSFITAVGYNKEHRVLKLILNGVYVYAYQDVPESAFILFLNSDSPGKYYARFRTTYAGVRLV